MNSHRHTGVVDRIVLLKGPIRTLFILEEVDQRATQMLLIDANKGFCHGENLHHVCSDPEMDINIKAYELYTGMFGEALISNVSALIPCAGAFFGVWRI